MNITKPFFRVARKTSFLALFLMLQPVANAATIKLFYNVDGTRGWKGGYNSIDECHQGARRSRYTAIQYYCSENQNYDEERRLGWRR